MAAGVTRLVLQAPAGFFWCMAEDGSGYLRDLFALFGFSCLSVFHAANVGIVDLHGLRRVFGPLHFLFMHHDLLDEEPQQLQCYTNSFLKRLII